MPLTIETPAPDARDLLTQEEAHARAAAVSAVRYDLAVQFAANAATFRGAIGVEFTLAAGAAATAAARGVFLCFRGRTIHAMRLNGVAITAPDWNGYRLVLPAAGLKLGAVNRLEVEYENAYDTGGDGVFRFIDPEDNGEYVYTNFEPYESHRMAPLFDQPDIKGRLSLRVLAPADWTVLANGGEAGVSAAEPDGRSWRTFIETPPLSSYLYCLAVGTFVGRRSEVRIPGRAEAIPVGLWSRRTLATFVEHDRFLRLTEQAFAFYADLFGRAYPFDKLDHIYCPEFSTGAMENVGLITYNEGYMFRSAPTPSDVTDLAEVVFHEVAHMWFGDLVTMRWWNDLWLNESFATYVSYLCLTEGSDFPGAWREFNVQLKRWALAEDDAPTTHPIAGLVADTDQTFLNFDGITYGKGGAVLKQLGARLGRAGLSAGLHTYFERHAYGNATLDDFLAALEAGSGVPLGDWSNQWLRTSGPNRFAVAISPTPGGRIARLSVNQEVVSGDPILREHLIRIALLRPAANGGVAIEAHEALISGAQSDIAAAVGSPLPIGAVPNLDDLAVGKVALDDATLRLVEERLEAIPDGLLRQVIWTAIWELVRDGRYPVARYAALLVDRLPEEPESTIVQQIAESTISSLLMRYLPDGERERWGSRLVDVARRRLARGGDEGMRIIWSRILVLAAVTPRDVEEGWQVATGETPLDGVEIDQDHRWALLVRGASFGSPQSAARLRAEALRDPSDRGQRALISAAVATPEVAAKHAAWARFFVPDGYGSVVRTTAAVAGFAWPWQRELLTPYLRQLPEALLALGAADSTFARNWFRAASLGLWGDPGAALVAIDAFLVNVNDPAHAIPEVDAARLRRLGLTERDALQRILRQRSLAAG